MSHRIFLHGQVKGPSSWDKILSCLPEEKTCSVRICSAFLAEKNVLIKTCSAVFPRYCEKVKRTISFMWAFFGCCTSAALRNLSSAKGKIHGTHCAAVSNAKRLLKIQNGIFSPVAEGSFRRDGIREETDDLPDQFHAEFTAGRTVQKSQLPRVSTVWKKDRANQKSSVALSELLPQARMEWLKMRDMKPILTHRRNWRRR